MADGACRITSSGYVHKLRLESREGGDIEIAPIVVRSFGGVLVKAAGVVLALGATVAVAASVFTG